MKILLEICKVVGFYQVFKKELNLTAATDERLAYQEADFIVIVVPMNDDLVLKCFDISALESVMETDININSTASRVL